MNGNQLSEVSLPPPLSPHGRRGQAFITLAIILAIFAVIPLSLVSFELHRVELAREELRSACEAAALAVAASLASSDESDPVKAHQDAMAVGLKTFRDNSVIGYSLATATVVASQTKPTRPGESNLFIQFLDPHNNLEPVAIGDPRGKVVRIVSGLCLSPAFAKYLNLGPVSLASVASSGVPDIDIVLCFDISGSIDDQTPVTFVRRQWDAATNKIVYRIPPTRGGAPAGSTATGRIFDVLGPPPTGSRVNAIYPQWLGVSNQDDERYPLNFSEEGTARGLRGTNDNSPPGNCPPGTARTGDAYTYTDLVVNIDGKLAFQGITVDGYKFPDVGTLVEAARGNLENPSVFKSSKANTALPGIIPWSGYQSAYFKYASKNLHPISEAQDAAAAFLNVMNRNTDAHFGLVAFAERAGTAPDDTERQANIDSSYAAGGYSNFPLPEYELSTAFGATNYEDIISMLPSTRANTATNIGDAIGNAVSTLQTSSRKGAKKAIVLFTDGEPTSGGPFSSNPWTNARQSAVAARNAGIPVYTIGLAQNAEIMPSEISILNDTNSNPTDGGIAAIAGNGGKFFLVTDSRNLRLTFENVARQLVQLVK